MTLSTSHTQWSHKACRAEKRKKKTAFTLDTPSACSNLSKLLILNAHMQPGNEGMLRLSKGVLWPVFISQCSCVYWTYQDTRWKVFTTYTVHTTMLEKWYTALLILHCTGTLHRNTEDIILTLFNVLRFQHRLFQHRLFQHRLFHHSLFQHKLFQHRLFLMSWNMLMNALRKTKTKKKRTINESVFVSTWSKCNNCYKKYICLVY